MRTEFARQGLGYVLSVVDIGADLAVDRLTRTRGELHGEVKVSTSLTTTRSRSGILHQARMNLSSTSARTSLAKTLAWRANSGDGIDWFELLEELCTRTLAAEREGEPIQMVGALPRSPTKPYRLDPVLPLGDPVILYGEGGVGKSTLAAAIAVSVETGVTIVPMWIPRRAPVLYLDWESGPAAINDRIAAIAAGANLPQPAMIRYRFMGRPLHDQVDEIASVVAQEKIGLVVVDSIGLAGGIGGDGDAAESAWRLFAAFRVLRSTVLAIDHVTKAAADDPDKPSRPYGSAYKGYLARATFELRRVDTPKGGVLGMFCTKYNDRARLAPMALVVDQDEDRIVYERDDELPGELAHRTPLADRIARALEDGGMTVKAIAAAIGSKDEIVRATLNRYKGRFSHSSTTDLWVVAKGVDRGAA